MDRKHLVENGIILTQHTIEKIQKFIHNKNVETRDKLHLRRGQTVLKKRLRDARLADWQFLKSFLLASKDILCYIEPVVNYEWKQAHSGPGASLVGYYRELKTRPIICKVVNPLTLVAQDGGFYHYMDMDRNQHQKRIDTFFLNREKAKSKDELLTLLTSCNLTIKLLYDIEFEALSPPGEYRNNLNINIGNLSWITHKIHAKTQLPILLASNLSAGKRALKDLSEEMIENEYTNEDYTFRASLLGERAYIVFSGRESVYYEYLKQNLVLPLIGMVLEYASTKNRYFGSGGVTYLRNVYAY